MRYYNMDRLSGNVTAVVVIPHRRGIEFGWDVFFAWELDYLVGWY